MYWNNARAPAKSEDSFSIEPTLNFDINKVCGEKASAIDSCIGALNKQYFDILSSHLEAYGIFAGSIIIETTVEDRTTFGQWLVGKIKMLYRTVCGSFSMQ